MEKHLNFYQNSLQNYVVYKLTNLHTRISVNSITAELSVYAYSHYYSFVPRFCLVHKCTSTGKSKYSFNSALCP